MTTTKHINRDTFGVTGMSCTSCAANVEKIVNTHEGVVDAKVNFANSSVLIEYDTYSVGAIELKSILNKAGFTLIIEEHDTPSNEKVEASQKAEYKKLIKQTIGASILTLPIMVISMFLTTLPYYNWILLALTIPVISIFGRRFYLNAFNQLKQRSANMDTLVATSTGVAFIFSVFNTIWPEFWTDKGLEPHVYYEAASAIIVFILLGKILEERAKSRTSSAIKNLIGLQPKNVTKIDDDGSETTIPIREVVVDDRLLVKPGEKIAVDGEVYEGESYVDESMISGEPIAVAKQKGDEVFAGTINQKGSFTFIAKKIGNKTFLAQIIKMVQEAQGSKAPVQKLVDKIAAVFVPVVISISIITFLVWFTLGGEHAFTHALLTSITVLVIACPCALGLATPTAIMVGIGKGAENNILIKDAESLEMAQKIDAIILDKTGTITEGKPVVTDLVWLEPDSSKIYSSILLEIERKSEHPLAEAVIENLQNNSRDAVLITEFESITGKGAKALHKAESYVVGNDLLMKENNIQLDKESDDMAKSLREEAKTVVFFANSRRVIAIIAIADKIKESSKSAVQTLQQKGIDVYMLTGDNLQTATAVAKQTGINQYKAETLPSDKADFVKKLQQKGAIVAMVGDGINDSHALAQADVSIAMGRGSDIAIDVAKMTLITSDLNIIPAAIELSKQTVKTIKQNLFWAFIYNLIGLPIAAGALYAINGFLLNPMIAAAAMAFSSVSVVLNSLRLKNKKLK